MKYRKKPIVIEAVQWNGTYGHVLEFTGGLPNMISYPGGNGSEYIVIRTLEGEMTLRNGDWIIKGVKGEFYPCKPDIFEATYEAVEP